MNRNILKAKWKQIHGRSRVLRGKLTHNRLDRFNGRIEVLAGKTQETYNVARNKAARGINRRTSNYRSSLKRIRPISRSR